MLQTIRNALKPSGQKSLAEAFTRLGWIGLWMQVAIGSIPLMLALYAIVFDRDRGAGTRAGFAMIEYMTVASLVVLTFTTAWFLRYIFLAKRIADPGRRPPSFSVQRTAWIGVAASTLGVILSMAIMLFEVVQLLIYFLRAPQAGVPVIQTTGTTGGGAASWVSAADVVNLMALSFIMIVEVVVLALSLWLLFRSMTASREYPDAGGETAQA